MLMCLFSKTACISFYRNCLEDVDSIELLLCITQGNENLPLTTTTIGNYDIKRYDQHSKKAIMGIIEQDKM